MIPLNDLGELSIMQDGFLKVFPTYTCGHCTDVVVMRADRTRERSKCVSCQRWLCEGNALCRVQCTPLHSLADDHFEGAGEYAKLVPAIMSGARTLEEARQGGLIVTD